MQQEKAQQHAQPWSDPAWQTNAARLWQRAHAALMQLAEAQHARQWLNEHGIQPTVWVKYGLGYANSIAIPGSEQIVAPAISVPWIIGGQVRAIRYFFLEVQGSYEHTLLPGSSVHGILYGGHVRDPTAPEQQTLLVVEGELNALCVAQATSHTNLVVLAADRETHTLPSAFYTYTAKYKHTIFWLNSKPLCKEASQQLTGGYQVQGEGKPTPVQLQMKNRLGEALARIRAKVPQTGQQKQTLLMDLLQAAHTNPVGVDRGTLTVIQTLAGALVHRERLSEIMPGHFVSGEPTGRIRTIKTLFPVKPENIPQALIEIPQWIGYQLVPKPNGKTDKIPKNPHSGGNASVTAPDTWSDFMTALNFAYHAHEVDGVAIVLSDQNPLVVIDIDDCVLPDGSLKPEAQNIVTELNSYSELSPSRRGVHIFALGKLPPGRRKSQQSGIEMYETERFMTVTGYHLPSTPKQVLERTDQLLAIHTQVFGIQNSLPLQEEKVEMTDSDRQLWQHIFTTSNGMKVRKLYEGDIAVSRYDASQAVIDLGNALAHWTKNDALRMKRMFYQTALKRDKWEERRGEVTWLDYQINDCIAYMARQQSVHP